MKILSMHCALYYFLQRPLIRIRMKTRIYSILIIISTIFITLYEALIIPLDRDATILPDEP